MAPTTSQPATATAFLKPRKARPFFARHPWVLSRAIERFDRQPNDGDVVELRTHKSEFIARGIYNSQSRISVRLYTWNEQEELDRSFWRQKLAAAIQCRRDLGLIKPDEASRLVFSEADGLSGLIVDSYGKFVVAQVNAAAMQMRLPILLELLADELQPTGILARSDETIAKAEGMAAGQRLAWGEAPPDEVVVKEHGLEYSVDLTKGQKTGLYLDQRDNRAAAARYMHGRRVLDLFCYSGGFGLCAARLGGASEVLGVDSSAAAVSWAEANAQRNGVTQAKFIKEKCFSTLDRLNDSGERFDAIILDPPKFSKNRFGVDEALRAYHRLNRVAVDLLSPGGVLVTCSCSGGVTPEDFMLMLSGVAEKSKRDIQVLEQRGAAADHPVRTSCLENAYLKCFICRVGD